MEKRPKTAESKLSRAVSRNALAVDPDRIVASDPELMESIEARWATPCQRASDSTAD